MENGQATTAPETGGINDLAAFLSDIPETDPADESGDTPADTAPESDTADEADDQADDQGPETSEDEADKTEPPPDRKIKVKTKDDDGTETELEVSEAELASSYLRQQDYTRKTQALSEREHQAFNVLTAKHDEMRSHYAEQAELAMAAVSQMAGLRSADEMAQMAQNDPAAWVAENQRQQTIHAFLRNLDGKLKGERSQAEQERARQRSASLKSQFETTWKELAKEKIDKTALTKIYGDVTKTYGFDAAELGNVYDHRLVKMMRDATAYQALKSKAPDVTRKAQEAPRLPASKQPIPADERRRTAINNRFSSGKGKLNDLAAYLSL